MPLRPSEEPLALPSDELPAFGPLRVRWPGATRKTSLVDLLTATGTTALVVVTGGRIVHEWYGPGAGREVVGRCFSVTKSFASALVGAAIAYGHIAGLESQVADYLPDFADAPVGALTLRHLLEMRSGLRFRPGPAPWSNDAICYLSPDCRGATRRARITDPVGVRFH